MCESSAYLKNKDGQEELLLEDVVMLKPSGGRIVLMNILGEKKEIEARTLPTFKVLLGTTTNQFYNSSRGDNYAQARYLCYYLQEKDLLQKFYKEFTANVKTDPSGYETLLKVLEVKDVAAFEILWQKWVMTLKF